MNQGTKMLIGFTLAIAVFVGAVALAAWGTWWVFPVVLAVHAAGTLVVVLSVRGAMTQRSKPDPVTEAAEAEGAIPESRERDEEPEFGIPERR